MGKDNANGNETTMGTAFDNLSDQRKFFVEAYLRTFNATRSAKEAAYSEDTARSQGSRLLTCVDVRAAIGELLDAKGVTAERIKVSLAEMAWDNDVAQFMPFLTGDKTMEALAAEGVNTSLVKSVTVSNGPRGVNRKVELYPRDGSLEKLGRVLAMFTDTLDVTTGGEKLGGGFGDLSDEEKATAVKAFAEDDA